MSAFVIWALVAATAVFWGLRQFVRGPSAPAYTVPIGDSTVVRGDLTRLLGAAPVAPVATVAAAPEISTRFRLVGVMAPRGDTSGFGIAVISIDGKPGRAFRVGAALDSGLMLPSVAQRSAAIANAGGDTSFTLELPMRTVAATGTLPAVSMTSQDAYASGAAQHPGGPTPQMGMQMQQQQMQMQQQQMQMQQQIQQQQQQVMPGFPPPPADSDTSPIELPPPPLDQNGQPLR